MNIKSKIIPTIVVVVVMVALISLGGYAWITHSPVYALAKKQIAAQKGSPVLDSEFRFAWWKSWSFSDEINGNARFVICESRGCHLVIASKEGNVWKIDSLTAI
jgi:hypothetical protein